MSRIGKQQINIPDRTTVTLADGVVSVKGPLGELSRPVKDTITITIKDSEVTFAPKGGEPKNNMERALWGTYASHVQNMIEGVNKPFEKKLILEGIGYRAEVSGKDMVMALGFSHPVRVPIPEDIKVTVEKGLITVSGINKESVGAFASKIRSFRPPEPYKGKGMRYEGEIVRRKQGKKSTA
jgi:large subunit ribosomal protein L6